MYCRQRTIARAISCSGVGVHSGKEVNLKIKPAPINHGIKFIRTDLQDSPCISARFNRVVDTSLATVIGVEGFIVSTIEHLMASFAGLSVDNALVEVDAHEMPIMDGSAAPFTRPSSLLIACCKLSRMNLRPRRSFRRPKRDSIRRRSSLRKRQWKIRTGLPWGSS